MKNTDKENIFLKLNDPGMVAILSIVAGIPLSYAITAQLLSLLPKSPKHIPKRPKQAKKR